MQNKNKTIILASVLVIITVVIGLVIWQDKNINNVTVSKQVTEVSAKSSEQTMQNLKDKEKSKLKLTNQIVEPIKADKPNAFAEDSIVNYAIYSSKFGACTTLTFIKEQRKKTENPLYWTDSLQEYLEKIKPKCRKIREQYPELSTYIDTLMSASEKQLEPNSTMSRYLDFNKMSFSKVETLDYLAIVGQKYPDLIPNSIMRTYEYNLSQVIPDLKDLLQTNNRSYVSKIENFAISFMACELGASCNDLSSLMLTYCFSEENFCVANFMELYNNRLSSGVKADIQLAVGYFKKLYQVH